MPTVELSSDAVHVRLSALEKLGALHGDLCIPLAQLASAESVAAPWQERPWRGLRVGTGLPRVILLGRMVSWNGSTDFCAIYGRRAPALVLHLRPGAHYRVVVVTQEDAPALARKINAALPPDAAAEACGEAKKAAVDAAQVGDNNTGE